MIKSSELGKDEIHLYQVSRMIKSNELGKVKRGDSLVPSQQDDYAFYLGEAKRVDSLYKASRMIKSNELGKVKRGDD
jgi:hypothetical protein